MQEKNIGSVVQIIGPVLDIRFPAGHLPDLLNAIEIERDGGKLVCEVAQQLGDDVVRCIAMSSTDGMVRGMEAVDTGSPIKVPVGNETLGRAHEPCLLTRARGALSTTPLLEPGYRGPRCGLGAPQGGRAVEEPSAKQRRHGAQASVERASELRIASTPRLIDKL